MNLTPWQRQMAAKVAEGTSLERPSRVAQIKPGAIKARGALLAADNEEPECPAVRESRFKIEASDAIAMRLQRHMIDAGQVW